MVPLHKAAEPYNVPEDIIVCKNTLPLTVNGVCFVSRCGLRLTIGSCTKSKFLFVLWGFSFGSVVHPFAITEHILM